MAKYAVVTDGTVTNIIRSIPKLDDSWRLITNDADVQIGDTFDGTDYSRADPIPPASVTRRQARLALLQAGVLSDVEDTLNALPSPAKAAALIEWQDASVFDYDHPLIVQVAEALNLDRDALFITAATL